MQSTLRRNFIFLLIAATLCISGIAKSQVRVTYTYPCRYAVQVSGKTTIGIRYAEPLSSSLLTNSSFIITGSLSGSHSGKVILAKDGRTVIFAPQKIFSPGERVTVSLNPIRCASGKMTVMYGFSFLISKTKVLPHTSTPLDNNQSDGGTSISNSNIPDGLPSDFPPIQITHNNNPSPGHYYVSNFTYVQSIYGSYLMVLDSMGNALFERNTSPFGAQDFRLQPNGQFTYFDLQKKKFYALNQSFTVIDSFSAANGYDADYHELCFLPNGSYALLALYTEKTDLTGLSGKSNASVIYYALQEFDQNKNLIFEWRTADSGHFSITDATHEDLTLQTVDYVHCNSIDFDPSDSTFILSSRNTDEITKIDPEDGTIIWRLGGKHNQFTMNNDPVGFSHQHDVRKLSNGTMTMFDNGNFHPASAPYSRAVEYSLDEKAKTLTQIWEFRHIPDVNVSAMGSVQILPNGNTLIGWGLCDSVTATEVKPDGSTAWEMKMPVGHYNYRMYKTANDALGSDAVRQNEMPEVALMQNYPNPFSNSSTITFTTSAYTPVTLIVYDALGREVRTLFSGSVEAGEYSAKFESGNLPAGIYICKLVTPTVTLSKTIILSK